MAIRRQNRTIWILAGVIFLLVLGFLFRDGQFEKLINEEAKMSDADISGANEEEEFGDKVGEAVQNPGQRNQARHKFGQALDKLAACFQMQSAATTDTPALQIESLYQRFQTDLGPVAHQSDRWMEWRLRTPNGLEKQLRLEITENDEGKIGRELHYFNLTRDGQPTTSLLDETQARNPSDEVINQLLKEGEVFYKERAAGSFFPNGERVEYVEKNGELAEIEFFKENKQFRCHDILVLETCQCL